MTAAEYRKLALALDGVAEHPHFEKTAFHRNGKIFATLDEADTSVVLKFTSAEQEAFSAIDAGNVAPVKGYWGTKGWTNVSLQGIEKKLLLDMLKISYHAFDKPVKPKAKPPVSKFPKLSKPAHRALNHAGILKLKDLTRWTEKDLLKLHGVGPKAIPLLRTALKNAGLHFKKQE